MREVLALVPALALLCAPGVQSGVVSVEVDGNHVVAGVELPGGLALDVDLRFEQAVGLTESSLGLSAQLVDPGSLVLQGRLPKGVVAALPLMLSIEPPAEGPLSFSGVVELALHTHNLSYVPATPLRLFTAQQGGPFEDVTATMGMGSYRVGANKPGFSEFLIVADIRPVDAVIGDKFQRLQAKLSAGAGTIPASLQAVLQGQLDAARAAHLQSQPVAAAQNIEQFSDTVKQNSGTVIPNVWRSARDLTNLAGELRSGAATLRFSLLHKASLGG